MIRIIAINKNKTIFSMKTKNQIKFFDNSFYVASAFEFNKSNFSISTNLNVKRFFY